MDPNAITCRLLGDHRQTSWSSVPWVCQNAPRSGLSWLQGHSCLALALAVVAAEASEARETLGLRWQQLPRLAL